MEPHGPTAACLTRAALETMAAGVETTAQRTHVDSCLACATSLGTIEADNDLLSEFVAVNAERLDGPAPLSAPKAPAGYEIESIIHQGAQGIVYRATQTSTHRVVALKVILGGMFTTEQARARFEREAELIAQLRHPHIVTVFDGGIMPDGTRFFAMEYVDGAPLAVDAERSARRSVEIILQVADAVASAHRRGIIHRDLKPANIVMDSDGRARVLDFGVAKRLEGSELDPEADRTSTGEFIGTLAYAAPEQLSGESHLVDTRSDLYALATILYELLSGARPHELTGSISEVIRTITEDDPARLESRCPELSRDLAVIAHRGLARDPERRYASVDAFAADLRRWGRGEAIEARRDDRWYVLRKTIRRYRITLSIALLFLATVIAFSAMTFRAYQQVALEVVRAKTIAISMANTLSGLDLENPDREIPVSNIASLLDNTAKVLDEKMQGMPDLEAPLRLRLGLAYLSYNMFRPAENQLRRARRLFHEVHAEPHPEHGDAAHALGRLCWQVARYEQAEQLYRTALAIRLDTEPGNGEKIASTLQHLASTLRQLGRLDEAMPVYDESLTMRRELVPPNLWRVALGLHVRGNGLRDLGRYQAAIDDFEAAIAIVRELADGPNWREGRTRANIASCLISLDRYDEAQEHLDASVTIKAGRSDLLQLGKSGVRYLQARIDLGRADLDNAELNAVLSLALRRAAYEAPHPDIADALILLGRVYVAQGRLDDAEPFLDEGRAIRTDLLGPAHWKTADANIAHGELALARGDITVAVSALHAAQPILESVLEETATARRRARTLASATLARRAESGE